MNKVFLIGNLTRDPELRTTSTGISVCSFGIAVNRRRGQNSNSDQPEVDYFRITAWRQLGELCQKYLAKGRKVAITGTIALSTYEGKDGAQRASLEVTADDIEFLTPRQDGMGEYQRSAPADNAGGGSAPSGGGFTQVDEDELPF